MKYTWFKNLNDRDGWTYDEGLFISVGETTIIKFEDSMELEEFAKKILTSIKEIRETYV